MAISISKYVDITSGVGGNPTVADRDFLALFISSSSSFLPGERVEFTSLADVATRVPTNSPEYTAAQYYFGYISKTATRPRALAFFRWVKQDSAPTLASSIGVQGATTLAAIKAANSITLAVTDAFGVVTNVPFTAIDLSSAADYEAVRAALQTTFRTSTNTQLQTCTVSYTASVGQFVITGSVTGSGKINAVALANPATDLAVQMNLLTASGGSSIPGVTAQSPLEAAQAAYATSDNYGSFGFIDSTSNPPLPLSEADVAAVAAWNHSLNNEYVYCVPTTTANATVDFDTFKGYSGLALTVAQNDFAEFCPAEALASVNYTRANGTINYMYTQFPTRSATVTTTPLSDAMDSVRANYIGQTMENGQRVEFYQAGVLMGGDNAATDINTYTNEMWLKSSIRTAMLRAFLGLPRIPANDTGRGIILANAQYSLDQGVTNGVISVGKTLTLTQRAFITQLTDDENAWQQVQNSGYWIDVQISQYVAPGNKTAYKATYVLIYSKDDQIRKVEGSNNLV